jgi:hypothetical protein
MSLDPYVLKHVRHFQIIFREHLKIDTVTNVNIW